MTEEIWRPVIGYETVYEVSNLGRIRRVAPYKGTWPGRILKPVSQGNGYLTVSLRQTCSIHVLVAEAFLGARPPLPPDSRRIEVNHIDGDKHNNEATNLEWTTSRANTEHAYRTGLQEPVRGEQNGHAKLTEADVRLIRSADGSLRQIARTFGVSVTTIYNVKSGVSWTHVDAAERAAVGRT